MRQFISLCHAEDIRLTTYEEFDNSSNSNGDYIKLDYLVKFST